MADTLRIKRRAVGGAAGAPTSLAAAEIAYNEQDDTLYYGKGNSGGAATTVIPIAGPGAFQAKDADLTSLAAAAATGVIYYRSAADTWGPVTIGSGLSFTSGTLSASASGGNVSNSGTPVAGQVAEWTDATHVAGVSTYAKLASPVFTGDPQAPTPAATDNDTSVATTAYVRSVVRDISSVRGLVGSANGTTAFMAYHECLMHDSAGVGVLVKNVGATSINMATVGANGRDTTLNDGDTSFYAIWGVTPGAAFVCSNNNPPAGPNLPSGYTHWAYLTSVKKSGGNWFNVAVRGNKVFFGTYGTVVSGANSGDGVWASYSVAAFVPLVATNFQFTGSGTASTGGGGVGGLQYNIGWSNTIVFSVRNDCYAANFYNSASIHGWLPNVNQTIYHSYSAIYNLGNFTTNGFSIYVNGYEVPNDS